MKNYVSTCSTVLLMIFSMATFSQELTVKELNQSIDIYNKSNCILCHGKTAKGDGKMTRLYRKMGKQLPSNFTNGFFEDRPLDYLTKIISDGGKAHQRSQFMPDFKGSITEKEVTLLARLIHKIGKDRKFPAKSK